MKSRPTHAVFSSSCIKRVFTCLSRIFFQYLHCITSMWSDFSMNLATGSCYFHGMEVRHGCLFCVQIFPTGSSLLPVMNRKWVITALSTNVQTYTGGLYEYIHQLCRPTSESIPAVSNGYNRPELAQIDKIIPFNSGSIRH